MLHGQVMVNSEPIATWTARRLVHPPQDRNDYEVETTYIDITGEAHTVRGVISHNYGDGAVRLAAEALEWAATELAAVFEKAGA